MRWRINKENSQLENKNLVEIVIRSAGMSESSAREKVESKANKMDVACQRKWDCNKTSIERKHLATSGGCDDAHIIYADYDGAPKIVPAKIVLPVGVEHENDIAVHPERDLNQNILEGSKVYPGEIAKTAENLRVAGISPGQGIHGLKSIVKKGVISHDEAYGGTEERRKRLYGDG